MSVEIPYEATCKTDTTMSVTKHGSEGIVGKKRTAATTTAELSTIAKKSKSIDIRRITLEEFITECTAVFSEKVGKSVPELTAIYHKYDHAPWAPAREWSAAENRSLASMLKELGFDGIEVVELNQMLPEGATMRNGSGCRGCNGAYDTSVRPTARY